MANSFESRCTGDLGFLYVASFHEAPKPANCIAPDKNSGKVSALLYIYYIMSNILSTFQNLCLASTSTYRSPVRQNTQ